ncbi:uncharacterized protein LOC128736256 [Sabethes cyaneus]|uniref:uncharacterized protein LOC128736256 n=1 Tax=Sabethes cyaneus TaxID=53552 RepID=UPI00237EDBC8|nr:uncharacterized protein LOC128736256 [Sabethes cyaneus]
MATSVNSRSESTGGILGPRKTMIIMVTVVGCIAILWPKVFYPMMVGPGQTKNVIKDHRGPGCCDVVLDQETFANTTIVSSSQQNLFRKRNIGPVAEDISIRQERPPHLRPDTIHPAMRERGRAIPQAGAIHSERPSSPPRIVEGRPGPIPGMRPPMGAGSHQPTKSANSMGFIMPLYTIGIVSFFIYTILKLVFKKTPAAPYPEIKPDPAFRNEVFSTNQSYIKRPDTGTTKLGQPISGTENGVPVSPVPVPCTSNGHSVQAEISGDYEQLAAKLEEHPATTDSPALECEQNVSLEPYNSASHELVDESKTVTNDELTQPSYDPTIEKVDDGLVSQKVVQQDDEETSERIIEQVASHVVQEVLEKAEHKVDEIIEAVATELVEQVIEQAEAFVNSAKTEEPEQDRQSLEVQEYPISTLQSTDNIYTATEKPEVSELLLPLESLPKDQTVAQLQDDATIYSETDITIESGILEEDNDVAEKKETAVAEVTTQCIQKPNDEPIRETKIETVAESLAATVLEPVDQFAAEPVALIESKTETDSVQTSESDQPVDTQLDNTVTEKTEETETETIVQEFPGNELQQVENIIYDSHTEVPVKTVGETQQVEEARFVEQASAAEVVEEAVSVVVDDVLEKVSAVSEVASPEQVFDQPDVTHPEQNEKELPIEDAAAKTELKEEIRVCEIELETSPDEEETAIKMIAATLDEAMIEQAEAQDSQTIPGDLVTETMEQTEQIAEEKMTEVAEVPSSKESVTDECVTVDVPPEVISKEEVMTVENASEAEVPIEAIVEETTAQKELKEEIVICEVELEPSVDEEETATKVIYTALDEAMAEQEEEQEIKAIAEALVTEVIEQAEIIANEKAAEVATETSNVETQLDTSVTFDEVEAACDKEVITTEFVEDAVEAAVPTDALGESSTVEELMVTKDSSAAADKPVDVPEVTTEEEFISVMTVEKTSVDEEEIAIKKISTALKEAIVEQPEEEEVKAITEELVTEILEQAEQIANERAIELSNVESPIDSSVDVKGQESANDEEINPIEIVQDASEAEVSTEADVVSTTVTKIFESVLKAADWPLPESCETEVKSSENIESSTAETVQDVTETVVPTEAALVSKTVTKIFESVLKPADWPVPGGCETEVEGFESTEPSTETDKGASEGAVSIEPDVVSTTVTKIFESVLKPADWPVPESCETEADGTENIETSTETDLDASEAVVPIKADVVSTSVTKIFQSVLKPADWPVPESCDPQAESSDTIESSSVETVQDVSEAVVPVEVDVVSTTVTKIFESVLKPADWPVPENCETEAEGSESTESSTETDKDASEAAISIEADVVSTTVTKIFESVLKPADWPLPESCETAVESPENIEPSSSETVQDASEVAVSTEADVVSTTVTKIFESVLKPADWPVPGNCEIEVESSENIEPSSETNQDTSETVVSNEADMVSTTVIKIFESVLKPADWPVPGGCETEPESSENIEPSSETNQDTSETVVSNEADVSTTVTKIFESVLKPADWPVPGSSETEAENINKQKTVEIQTKKHVTFVLSDSSSDQSSVVESSSESSSPNEISQTFDDFHVRESITEKPIDELHSAGSASENQHVQQPEETRIEASDAGVVELTTEPTVDMKDDEVDHIKPNDSNTAKVYFSGERAEESTVSVSTPVENKVDVAVFSVAEEVITDQPSQIAAAPELIDTPSAVPFVERFTTAAEVSEAIQEPSDNRRLLDSISDQSIKTKTSFSEQTATISLEEPVELIAAARSGTEVLQESNASSADQLTSEDEPSNIQAEISVEEDDLERQAVTQVVEEQDRYDDETISESIITTEDLNDTGSNDPVIYNGDETTVEVIAFSDDTAERRCEKSPDTEKGARSSEGPTIEEIVDDNITPTEEGKTIDEFVIKFDIERVDTSELISEVIDESSDVPCTTRVPTALDVISENQEELLASDLDRPATTESTSNEQVGIGKDPSSHDILEHVAKEELIERTLTEATAVASEIETIVDHIIEEKILHTIPPNADSQVSTISETKDQSAPLIVSEPLRLSASAAKVVESILVDDKFSTTSSATPTVPASSSCPAEANNSINQLKTSSATNQPSSPSNQSQTVSASSSSFAIELNSFNNNNQTKDDSAVSEENFIPVEGLSQVITPEHSTSLSSSSNTVASNTVLEQYESSSSATAIDQVPTSVSNVTNPKFLTLNLVNYSPSDSSGNNSNSSASALTLSRNAAGTADIISTVATDSTSDQLMELDLLRRKLDETEQAMTKIIAKISAIPKGQQTSLNRKAETEETDNREETAAREPKSNGHLVETLDSTIESNTTADEQQDRLPDTDEEAPTKVEKQHQHETGAVPKKREPSEDRATLKVIPMEKKAKYEPGMQSSRPGTPVQSLTLDSAHVEVDASESKCILLDSKAPQTSKVVVADPDLSIETLDATHKHDDEAPVVLSGKMKLSLVKLDDNDKSSSSAVVTEVKDSVDEKDDSSHDPLRPSDRK